MFGKNRAIACNYFVGITRFDVENQLLFPIVVIPIHRDDPRAD